MEQMRMRDADARGTLDDEMERMILDRKPDGPLACFRWGMWTRVRMRCYLGTETRCVVKLERMDGWMDKWVQQDLDRIVW
jgi:hypothetical protein